MTVSLRSQPGQAPAAATRILRPGPRPARIGLVIWRKWAGASAIVLAAAALVGCAGSPAAAPRPPAATVAGPTASPSLPFLTPTAASTAATQPPAAPTDTPVPDTPVPVDPGPAELVIPVINLQSLVTVVPLTAEGWDVEGLGQQVGRLEGLGRRPGDSRAMVLTAHVNVRTGMAGAFGRLSQLVVGDEIVYRWGGTEFAYRVARRNYLETNQVRALFDAPGGHLLLLTCAGFDPSNWTYTQRLLITAEPAAASAP